MEELYPDNKKYRVYYIHKHWVGKADPTNAGRAYIYSNDPGFITDQCTHLKRTGCRVLRVEKNTGGVWKTL